MEEAELRTAAFDWLRIQDALHDGVVPWDVLTDGFLHKGIRITLAGPPGIWKPQCLQRIPLSIRSAHQGPYADSFTDDGWLRYKYRGTDPEHRDNVGLREALRTRTPLVYLHAVVPGLYRAVWPVFIVRDDPRALACDVAIDPAYALGEATAGPADPASLQGESYLGIRRYVATQTWQRIHQSAFRVRVVAAYQCRCTLCRLGHKELLDAAHIIADKDLRGEPVVPNGLCLCKIHHAAFDANLIGVSADYRVKVRPSVLEETDGPMLQHGLKGFEGSRIDLPHRIQDRPDRERLDARFAQFLAAAS